MIVCVCVCVCERESVCVGNTHLEPQSTQTPLLFNPSRARALSLNLSTHTHSLSLPLSLSQHMPGTAEHPDSLALQPFARARSFSRPVSLSFFSFFLSLSLHIYLNTYLEPQGVKTLLLFNPSHYSRRCLPHLYIQVYIYR